ncbi:hypothetical protein [Sphingomonas sp.]|uniref:hypothetical protein n=1 Tax=Sphingomonas sp. TaxID=28214 RepID=UPI00286A0018|nr:hypothetical protein [Sphingomonas sp.]
MPDELLPPWLKYPHIGLGSIGWRMGYGEDYWMEFDDWYLSLASEQRVQYRAKFPEPTEVEQGLPWTGFYDRKEKN